MSDNIHEDLIDCLDLLNYTLSPTFENKWRFRYGAPFVKNFQLKLMEVLKTKPIKQSTLFAYLTKRCKYPESEVTSFFTSIEIDLYSPIIKK